jgi:hypothetical protein
MTLDDAVAFALEGGDVEPEGVATTSEHPHA